MGLSRREFLKTSAGIAAAVSIFSLKEAFALDLDRQKVVPDPFDYPYTGWESLYRDQSTYDEIVPGTHALTAEIIPEPRDTSDMPLRRAPERGYTPTC